jgi:hypothetical protein
LLAGLNQLANLSQRQKMAKKCQSLIDAKGCIRIVDQILKLAGNRLKESSL